MMDTFADISLFNNVMGQVIDTMQTSPRPSGYSRIVTPNELKNFQNPEPYSQLINIGADYVRRKLAESGGDADCALQGIQYDVLNDPDQNKLGVHKLGGSPDKPITIKIKEQNNLESALETVIHELLHAVSDLPQNKAFEPYIDALSTDEEKALRANPDTEYALYRYGDDDVYREYTPTLFRDQQHFNNVISRINRNTVYSSDEVINKPYSAIQSYMCTGRNGNTQSMRTLLETAQQACQIAREMNDCANSVLFRINYHSQKNNLTQDDMQKVPLVRDNSSGLYSTSSEYSEENPFNGMYASDKNWAHRAISRPVDQRKPLF